MKKHIGLLLIAAVAGLLLVTSSCTTKTDSYAEDRAQIMDLQARYLFALDFFDMDAYVSTFTPDGILDIIEYQAKGRDEIRKRLEESRPVFDQAAQSTEGAYRPSGRHNITNIVLRIDGDRATGRAYWFHYGNNNPERRAVLDAYGHYEDEMVKVDGQWLFSKRTIYNEAVEKWIAPPANPAW
ncbi:MAG: nuclear transport factor 2 family protein [Acidobacteria bacterium]|nr:nuclear transport factor 2 family protein [Acidobacteriota bacterium]